MATLHNEYNRRGRPLEARRMNKTMVITSAWPHIRNHSTHLPRYIPQLASVPLPQPQAPVAVAPVVSAPQAPVAVAPVVSTPAPLAPVPPAGAVSGPLTATTTGTGGPAFQVTFALGTWSLTHLPTGVAVALQPVGSDSQGYWSLTQGGTHVTQGPHSTTVACDALFSSLPAFGYLA